MKKTPGDIILHKCTKNHDHMLYCSWYMAYDRCNCYFSFWATFCPFNPLTAQKIKISKQWKQHLEILSFYTCVPEIMIRWCMVPEKLCTTDEWMDRQKKWHMRWVPHLKIEVTKYRTVLLLFFLNWTNSCLWFCSRDNTVGDLESQPAFVSARCLFLNLL